MIRVLEFGTYPIAKPVHGGQRRTAAFADYYEKQGIAYTYASTYVTQHFRRDEVTAHDVPLGYAASPYEGLPLVDDLRAGHYAAEHPEAFARFRKTAEEVAPDFICLGQPFMWPLVRKLRQLPQFAGTRLIYASHNVEGPLKDELLQKAGVELPVRRRIRRQVDQIEREIALASDLIVAVSEDDADVYRAVAPEAEVVTISNSVSRPPARLQCRDIVSPIFADNRFLFFVGSAYPPNIEGFCNLAAGEGIFFTPPTKSLAVCGGVCDGIYANSTYQRYAASNAHRVQFFPKIDDDELWLMKRRCHGTLLPILTGGGSNLKTAEALVLGKWVVATPLALRGFEAYANLPNVMIANNRQEFQRAAAIALRSPAVELPAATTRSLERLYWDRSLGDSGLASRLDALLTRPRTAPLRHTA